MSLPRVAQSIYSSRCRGSQYLNDRETGIVVGLVQSVRPRVMFEFGCNTGRTAKAILDNVTSLELYVGVDVPPSHRPVLDCQRTEVPLRAGVYCRDDRFKLLLRDSRTLVAEELEPCDAVFIDGDHSEEGVRHDSALALELVRPGGVIVWHDYANEAVEVTEVLDEYHRGGLDIKHVDGTWLAFLRR